MTYHDARRCALKRELLRELLFPGIHQLALAIAAEVLRQAQQEAREIERWESEGGR